MGLSNELQLGKAGEHLVCFNLILQGYNAFLADQGLPFDVLIEKDGELKKIQVKTTTKLVTYGKAKNIYRFGLRNGKGGRSRIREVDCDYYAFVALDIKEIAYIPMKEMYARSGKLKQTMDFKSRKIEYTGRIYSNGTVRQPEWGKYIEDFSSLERRGGLHE